VTTEPEPSGHQGRAGSSRHPAWLRSGWLLRKGVDPDRGHLLLIIVAAGVFNTANDQTSIVVVLPALILDIGMAIDEFYLSSWIVNGYLLGYLVALPIVGRIADVFGLARVFAATLVIFMIGSVLVAVAPTFEWIVVARTLQAIGGGGVVPVAMAIVVDQLPPGRRLMGLGAIAAATEAGALIGPAWGGMITEWFGWRTVFWVNLPLVAPTLLGAWWLSSGSRRGGTIDWIGAALLGASLAVLTYGLVTDPVSPRPLPTTLGILAISGFLALAFFWHERRLERAGLDPMVRLGTLLERHSASANLAMFFVGVGLITALMGVPLFVNLVLVEGALEGGLTLMRLTIAVPLGALLGGWLGGRVGLRRTSVAGCLLIALGFAGLQSWDEGLTQFMRSVPQLVGGLGFGLVLAPLSAAVLQRVRDEERATAAAWLTLARMAGMLVGAALLTSHGLGRFYARAGALDFGSSEFLELVAEAQVTTFREVFIAAGILMVCAAVVSIGIGKGHPGRPAALWGGVGAPLSERVVDESDSE